MRISDWSSDVCSSDLFKRSHAKTSLLAHDGVDLVIGSLGFLGRFQALYIHAATGVVHNEARHIPGPHRRVPHATRQGHQRIACLLVAEQSINNLNHLHAGYGIEEVKTRHAPRTLTSTGNGGNRKG